MERELKLELDPDRTDALIHTPLLAAALTAPPHVEALLSTYFDTPQLELHRQGISLRVRETPHGHVQTVKLQGTVRAGLYKRAEYQSAVAGNFPDLHALGAVLPARLELDMQALGARLAPLFSTHVQRTLHLLRLRDGTQIELALDRGTVRTGHTSRAFQEVELELKRGQTAALYGFTLELLGAVPMQLSYLSKGDRGFALLAGEHHTVARAQALKLKTHDSVERAFERVLRNCLAQIDGNARGVALSDDAESVHQMRVGIRRLRSAFDLFAPWISVAANLQDELKWLAGELGHARDWYVLEHTTLPAAFAQASADVEPHRLQHAVSHRATLARKRAAHAVATLRYARLVLELACWHSQAAWRDVPQRQRVRHALRTPMRQHADALLHDAYQRFMKRARHLPSLDGTQRHRARKAAKKLRYAGDFLSALYPKRQLRPFAAALGELQDGLGWRNDAVAAEPLLNKLSTTHADAAAGAAYVRGFLAARLSAQHGALRTIWRRFKRTPCPRLRA
jgi:inorganic triphosphatase YgiF